LRKGRCSNDPNNCTLAVSRAELPYAGIDSVCPECGSPLAAIAITTQQAPPVSPPPPPVSVPPPSPIVAQPTFVQPEAPRYEERPLPPPDMRTSRYRDEDYDEPPQKDGFMKLTQMVIVGAAVALLGFFAWRMFLQPRPVTAPDLAAAASVTGVAGQQVTQISPAQLRRVIVVTQAHGTPDAAGPIVAQLPVGSTLDVTGQIQVNGVNWLRVSLPNDSSKSGFVREDQMGTVGDGTLSVTPLDQLPGAMPPTAVVPGSAATETIGPVQARAPSTFYIASRQANIRQEANVTSGKVGTFEFSDPITVIGERTVGGRTWYQVQLPSGGSGWINGRLVSAQPRAQAIDAVVPPATKPKVVTKPTSDGEISDVGKADNQAALMAMGPGATMRVDATIANLRKEPGATGNSVVETLPRDTLMSVEDIRILDGVPWYRVTSPQGAQGWISGRTVVENK
jgi:uncharacterized protein YgiM (DUF1202 family)